jgi:hypothetical protein
MAKKLRFKKEKKINIKKDGSEAVSSKPTELRAKLSSPVTLRQKMTSMWKEFQFKEKERQEIETIADASDFDISNETEQLSGYEVDSELSDALNFAEEAEAQFKLEESAPDSSAEAAPVADDNPEKSPEKAEIGS